MNFVNNKNYFALLHIRHWTLLFRILLISVLLDGQIGNAQSIEKMIPLEGHLIRVKHWAEKDGIPHWYLGGMFEDSRGIIWGEW